MNVKKKAQAALMYDTVTLVAETLNRMLRKKADAFRSSGGARGGSKSGGGGGGRERKGGAAGMP